MGPSLLACRVVLAVVFVVAGIGKLADLPGSRRAVTEFGVPARLAHVLGVVLPVGELAVAVALLITPAARVGALGAGLLLLAFIAAIGTALAAGREPDCHCFGQVHTAPVGPRTLARNTALLGLAGFVAIGGWRHPGVSATHWVSQASAAWLVAIAAGVVIAGLVGFQVWFSLQLLAQNGRTIARLGELEGAIARLTGEDGGLMMDGEDGPEALGADLSGAGLPVGSRAPDFVLPDVHGQRHSLASMRADRPVLLVFSAANCGPCQSLMPELARWQLEHAERLQTVVIAAGDPAANRAKADEHGLDGVLIDRDRETAELYEAVGTPMALVVGADGLIQSPTVGGTEAIRTLVRQATRPPLTVRQVRSAHENGRNGSPAAEDRIGQPAPELELHDLDDNRVELKDLYADRTVAIFWNPGCGFCQQMLPELRALELRAPERAAQLVVISSGEPDQVRQDGLRSRVLLDPESEAMRAFGAEGTPMGVVIQDGVIASPVAAGGPAVLELIEASSGHGPLA